MKRIARTRGVTLAELLIAVAFLGVCAAVVSDTIMNGVRVTGAVQRRSSAMASAKDAIDYVIDLSETAEIEPSVTSKEIELGNGTTARRTVTIVEDKNLPADVFRVQCKVEWKEQSGSGMRNDEVVFETLVGRRTN